jgi:acyl-CoA reductase-like NAD-dependent aldehyde dehydrogenase
MTVTRGNFIAGMEAIPPDRALLVRKNPADEREVLVRHVSANAEDIECAFAIAREAGTEWGRTQGPRRAEILHRAATLIESDTGDAAAEISLHAGKTRRDADAEVARAASLFRFFAEQARNADGEIGDAEESGTTIFNRREPIGTVGLITPWNFPLAIPARKVAPALAFGNTVVLKPSPLAALPALRLAATLVAAGLPAGCLNVVVGDAEAGQALTESDHLDALSFTGSTTVGRLLIDRLASRIPVQAEMGGHSPVIVLRDADLETAAEIIVRGAFQAAGQTCTATRRAIVEKSVYTPVLKRLVERASRLRLGPPIEPATDVPPLIASERRDAVEAELERALAEGAKLREGGRRPGGELHHGAYLQPTLLDDVTPEMRIAQREVFGPVLSLMTADDFDDALEIAERTPFGLSAAIVTNDLGKALEFARSVRTGMVHVNRPTVGSDPQMPFGGARDSSHGPAEQGLEARCFYTHVKTVYLRS